MNDTPRGSGSAGRAVRALVRLSRDLLWLLVAVVVTPRYRLRALGAERIPATGGVLLLGNHVSWIDWAIVQLACPRPLRFVMERSIYDRWYWRGLLRFFGVIPINGSASRGSLTQIRGLLNRGEVVCLFPEGAISRNGQLGEFKRGFERAASGASGVIVPFYLRGMWGSLWSRSSPQLRRHSRQGQRRHLLVAFGQPLPMATPASRVKQQVVELSLDVWDAYSRQLDPLPLAWLKTAKAKGGATSVIDQTSGELSHRKLLTGVLLFSRRIARLSPEPRVAVMLPASAGAVLTSLALLLRGSTLVNLNYTVSEAVLRRCLAKSGARTVYTSRLFLKRLNQRGIYLEQAFEGYQVVLLEDLRQQIGTPERLLMLAAASLLPAAVLYRLFGRPVDGESPAALLFSSGSEGEPKGVLLSHRNIMANIRQVSDVLNTREGDRMVSALPPFHSFGLTVTCMLPLVGGMPLICQPDPTDVLGVARAIARYRGTVLCATATLLRLYARHHRVQPLMLEPLRVVVAGAEKLPASVRQAFEEKFHKRIYEGYGATETTPVASVNLPDHLDTDYWSVQVGQKPGSVGLPLPGTAFRVVDPDTLQTLSAGQEGLVLISGAQVMLGYLNDPERTAEALVELDGRCWYRSGDKGYLDQDGFLTIVDRYSRFAKVGGEMVSLTAVEEALRPLLPRAVAKACSAEDADLVAVRLPDTRKGEQVVVLVTSAVNAGCLRGLLPESGLPPLAQPDRILPVPEIPCLGGGKKDIQGAQRLAARELLLEEP